MRSLGRVVSAAATVYGVVAALAIVSWHVVGDRWWNLSVNVTTFWWSLAGATFLVVALLFRAWRVAAVLAVPAGLFVWAFGGLFVGSAPVATADLRVATYNSYIRAPDVSHVSALVRDWQPDVLLLQEVQPARAAVLERTFDAAYPHRHYEQREADRIGGVAVLSRFPIVDIRDIEPIGHARATFVAVLDVGGESVQVVPVHLTSPCPTCGQSVVGRQAFEADMRRAEVDAIVDQLDPRRPAIVGGDLNSTRRNDPYRLLAARGFRDPQIEAGAGPGFTWPDGSGPFFRVDWVLARGLVPAGAWVGPPRGSDHRPVIVDLALHTYRGDEG